MTLLVFPEKLRRKNCTHLLLCNNVQRHVIANNIVTSPPCIQLCVCVCVNFVMHRRIHNIDALKRLELRRRWAALHRNAAMFEIFRAFGNILLP